MTGCKRDDLILQPSPTDCLLEAILVQFNCFVLHAGPPLVRYRDMRMWRVWGLHAPGPLISKQFIPPLEIPTTVVISWADTIIAKAQRREIPEVGALALASHDQPTKYTEVQLFKRLA